MKTEKIARLDTQEPFGTVVYGWLHAKPCGCYCLEGMRLDKHEPITGVGPCELHKAECEAFLERLGSDMPDPDRPLHYVVTEYFDEAIPEEET